MNDDYLTRRAELDEYLSDLEYDRKKRDHDLYHNDDVDECQWCNPDER